MKLSIRMHAPFAAALLFSAATVAASAESAKSEYVETIDQTFPLAANGSFTLSNKNGSIELNAWDKNEIRVVADKKMRLDGGAWWIARFIGLKSNTVETDADARALFA